MIGDEYILDIAAKTQRDARKTLYWLYCPSLFPEWEGDPHGEEELDYEEFFEGTFEGDGGDTIVGRLATGIAMYTLDEPVEEERQRRFCGRNQQRIKYEASTPSKDEHLCEILSGAAYNIGYGRYVKAGGGRLINRYLGFIRLERNIRSRSDSELLIKMASDLGRLDPAILGPILRLKELNIWRSRSDNPNELAYYEAVHALALERIAKFER